MSKHCMTVDKRTQKGLPPQLQQRFACRGRRQPRTQGIVREVPENHSTGEHGNRDDNIECIRWG